MTRLGAFFVGALILAGSACTKFPAEGGSSGSKRLIFNFTMDEPINQNFVYIVAIFPSTESNPTTQGPIPVVFPPWGNGFVAGNASYYVLYPNPSPTYGLYRFTDTNLINSVLLGAPVNFLDVQPGGRTIRFDLDINQIAPTQAEADAYQSVQVNFLTMDKVPQGNTGTKAWDALGDPSIPSEINSPITISLRQSATYDNRFFNDLEVRGDVADPSLDIVNFSVEVRLF